MGIPRPGSPAELAQFARLQRRLGPLFRRIFRDPLAPRTVLVVPSLSLDAEVMAKISGLPHYEERLLCMLMLLRLPRTRVVYVSSRAIDPTIIDYYLHLLAGIPHNHARRRLTLLDCDDSSAQPLSAKILERPTMVRRLRAAIGDTANAHMVCFNVSEVERTLSVRLGVPLYGCDPTLLVLGSKSGSRHMFRAAGIRMPDGSEDLRDPQDIAGALARLKRRHHGLRRATVKLNYGFSGEGNATFSFTGYGPTADLERRIARRLPKALLFEGHGERWNHYRGKFREMGGIVEEFIEGSGVRSPSVQCRIDPLGTVELISTHEQVLGGPSGQVFLGCEFPAREQYRLQLQEAGERIGNVLRDRGVIGRFAVDFVSVRRRDRWDHFAVEINLRKGGTTRPFLMLQFLTDGAYERGTGLYRTGTGRPRYYFASDNLQQTPYVGLTPDDLVDIAVENGLHFSAASQEGVVFHFIGALPEFGKLGLVCIGADRPRARTLYDETVAVLDREARRRQRARYGGKVAARKARSARKAWPR